MADRKLLPACINKTEQSFIRTWLSGNCTVEFTKTNLLTLTYTNLIAEVVRYVDYDEPDHPIIAFASIKYRSDNTKMPPMWSNVPAKGTDFLRFLRLFHQVMLHYDEVETLNSNIKRLYKKEIV